MTTTDSFINNIFNQFLINIGSKPNLIQNICQITLLSLISGQNFKTRVKIFSQSCITCTRNNSCLHVKANKSKYPGYIHAYIHVMDYTCIKFIDI